MECQCDRCRSQRRADAIILWLDRIRHLCLGLLAGLAIAAWMKGG